MLNNHVPISAVIIANNAAKTIGQVLQAISNLDEILVVDSGSTDDTVKICESYGCRVIHHAFEGYGRQKHFAVEQAQHDWVWVIDADEVASPQIIEEARNLIDAGKYQGLMVPISLVFLGKLLRFGNEYKKPHLRLFNKKFGNYNDSAVHEDVVLKGEIGVLKHHILHYSYATLDDYFRKFNEYTSRAAEQMRANGKRSSLIIPMIKFPFAFIILYIFKGLILDGLPGLLWALFSSLYSLVKQVKLWELNQQRNVK